MKILSQKHTQKKTRSNFFYCFLHNISLLPRLVSILWAQVRLLLPFTLRNNYFIIYYICLFVCVHAQVSVEVKGQPVGVSFSFHHLGSGVETKILRLGQQVPLSTWPRNDS